MSGELAIVFGLAGSVAIVGMPHGGLDHLFGRATFEPIVGRWWRPAFAGFYLGVAALVVAGWLVSPILTTALFFLISAYHFGAADGRTGIVGVVEGGAVIWVPILARPEEVATIVAWVIPGGHVELVLAELSRARPILWAAVVVFVSDLLILSARRDGWIAARLAVFALAFALLPVLVSFGLFFCGWHSVRELVALARQACPTRPWRGFLKVVRLAAPRAALAVMATAGAAWWFAAERALTSVVAQAVFLGLSAVAVPHILLHAAANRLRANPFARENDWCPTAVIT